jgi:heat shock factor-binding protein 1
VDELLNSLSNKFAGVSSEIFAKSAIPSPPFPESDRATLRCYFFFGSILEETVTNVCANDIVDEMSRRLDSLEATLQSNQEARDGKNSPTKM